MQNNNSSTSADFPDIRGHQEISQYLKAIASRRDRSFLTHNDHIVVPKLPAHLAFLSTGWRLGVLLTFSPVFLHFNILHNPVSSLSFQLSLLLLQLLLLGLLVCLGCRHPYNPLAEVIFVCNAYIISRSERLWPESFISMHGLKFQPI